MEKDIIIEKNNAIIRNYEEKLKAYEEYKKL